MSSEGVYVNIRVDVTFTYWLQECICCFWKSWFRNGKHVYVKPCDAVCYYVNCNVDCDNYWWSIHNVCAWPPNEWVWTEVAKKKKLFWNLEIMEMKSTIWNRLFWDVIFISIISRFQKHCFVKQCWRCMVYQTSFWKSWNNGNENDPHK